ncbi:hypothetical protein D3C84_850570 [compost metagenome]
MQALHFAPGVGQIAGKRNDLVQGLVGQLFSFRGRGRSCFWLNLRLWSNWVSSSGKRGSFGSFQFFFGWFFDFFGELRVNQGQFLSHPRSDGRLARVSQFALHMVHT